MIKVKTHSEVGAPASVTLSEPIVENKPQVVAEAPIVTPVSNDAKVDHGGSSHLPPGPWQDRLHGAAKKAVNAYLTAFDLGDRVSGLSWREKIAQIFSHNDIAGTIAGTGAGDIVDRFHEGLNTSRSLVRSVDLDQELLARAEYGPAPSPISYDRISAIVDRELERLDQLGDAQKESSAYRSAPGVPLVADRRLFALARVSSLAPGDGEAWIAIKARTEPGGEPTTVRVHVRLDSSEFREQKAAIELLGVNLAHGVYFQRQNLIGALNEGLPPGWGAVDFVDISGPGFAQQGSLFGNDVPPHRTTPPVEFPRPQIGKDKKALHKAQVLINSKKAIGVVAEIGASQLVAETFRRAVGSESTLWQRVSNYGMEMSSFMYGVQPRSVSKARLADMLRTEFDDFSTKAASVGADGEKNIFAFANTVATRADGPGAGWVGVEFTSKPGGPRQQIMMHVRMLSPTVPEQEEALKMLGINLLHASQMELQAGSRKFLKALTDNIAKGEIQIDHLEAHGGSLTGWGAELLNLQALEAGHSPAVLFNPSGHVEPIFERYYGRSVVVRPEKLPHETALNAFDALHDPAIDDKKKGSAIHLSLQSFRFGSKYDLPAVIKRAQSLAQQGYEVIVTKDAVDFSLIKTLAQSSNTMQTFVLSPTQLRRLLDPKVYVAVEGGIDAALKPLFDAKNIRLHVPGDQPLEFKSQKAAQIYHQLVERGIFSES